MSKLVLLLVPATTVLALICLTSCVNKDLEQPFGLVEEHSGYVPARIAVLPCIPWPAGARFSGLPLSNTAEQSRMDICLKFDTFVIDGFKDQPYMRGFSPSWVKKLLESSNNQALTGEIDPLWQHTKDSCRDCKTPAAFYQQSIANRTPWLKWLSDFSGAVRNADAVLLPFVTASYEKVFMDRGLHVKQRGASVVMLLVDTNNGNLLWSGGRDAFANEQSLTVDKVENDRPFPSWDLIYERLFTEDVWRDFPGRQIFR